MVRFKSRYVLACVIHDQAKASAAVRDKPVCPSMRPSTLADAVRTEIRKKFGLWGLASVSIHVKYVNAITGMAIIRCQREWSQMLVDCLPSISRIGKDTCQLEILHQSGTIRACQRKLMRLIAKDQAGQDASIGELLVDSDDQANEDAVSADEPQNAVATSQRNTASAEASGQQIRKKHHARLHSQPPKIKRRKKNDPSSA